MRQRLSTVYTGAVGRKMSPKSMRSRRPSIFANKKSVKLVDGPWRGHSLRLEAFGDMATLEIVIRGDVGRYIDGKWCPKNGAQNA